MPLLHLFLTVSITFIFLKISIPTLKKIIPANPTRRGMHKEKKASSGGVLFIFIYIIYASYQNFFIPFFSIPISIIGLIDDKFSISKRFRLAAQILTISSFLTFSYIKGFGILANINFSQYFIFIFVLLLLIGTSIINFMNFMDGIDGLVCGCMIVIFSFMNIEIHYLLPIIGTLTGFLFFNWEPSKVFMGDSGSLFLGSYLSTLILGQNNFISILNSLILCSPILLDALTCILIRIRKKQNILLPHRLHLYQRLVSAGFSHSKVSSIYIASTFFLGLVYLTSNTILLVISLVIVISLGLHLNKNYAVSLN